MLSSLSFRVFLIIGMWRPLSWTSKCKMIIYKIYIFICVTIYSSFVLVLLLYFSSVQNLNEFTLHLFFFSAAFSIWVKMLTIICRRKIILDTEEILSNELCQPKNLYESRIVDKYSHIVRISTICFIVMTSTNAMSLVLTSLAKKNDISLPLKMFIPYSLESNGIFFATYLYQSVSLIMSALITSSVECFALMMILIICGQFEIFIYRLNLLTTIKRNNKLKSSVSQCEEKLIKNFVQHHNCMYSLGVKMNNIFGTMIFVQFFASLIQLCTAIFQLSRMNFKNHDLWSTITLFCSSFLQLYLYSFSGEKIMEKSSLIAEEIYQTKWNKLTNRSRKNLILIMIRASRPIKLIGSSFVVMSLDTFVKVVKLSFSTYNLLIKL